MSDTQSGATTRFLYDGDALVAEYDAAGAMLHRYVHGPGVPAPAEAGEPWFSYQGATVSADARRQFEADPHGSIVTTADALGYGLSIDSYDEYGIPPATNQGRFQYTGQAWLPELGMYYYKARIYSPTLGRFLQTDPIGYADQFNLYVYAGDEPVNHTDPTGEGPEIAACGLAGPLAPECALGDLAISGLVILFGGAAVMSSPPRPHARFPASDRMVTGNHNGGPPLQRPSEPGRPAGIIYQRIDRNTDRCYVGRCNNEELYERRQRDHQRANPEADYRFRILERAEPGGALRQAEQRQIESHGGPTNRSNPNGGAENKRNEIRCNRQGVCTEQ